MKISRSDIRQATEDEVSVVNGSIIISYGNLIPGKFYEFTRKERRYYVALDAENNAIDIYEW